MIRWNQLHEEVLTFARRRSQEEHSLGRLLLRVKKARLWQHLGLKSIYAYARSFMDLTTRQTKERLRVAMALKTLPKINATLAAGTIHWSAVRELLRVVTSENESQWLEQVADKSVDEIATMIDGTQRGDDPPDPKVPRRRRVILRMMPSVLALYREAQAKLREDSGGELSEEDGLMLMSRMVLGNVTSGTSAYQIQMTVCENCGSAAQKSGEHVFPVEPREVEQARCDAELIGADAPTVHPSTSDVREIVVGRQDGRCGLPGCQHEISPEVHVLPGEVDGTPDPDLRVALCPAHHAATHRGDLRAEGRWADDRCALSRRRRQSARRSPRRRRCGLDGRSQRRTAASGIQAA